MHDRYRIILERRPGGGWNAELVPLGDDYRPATLTGTSGHADGPGAALELVGQELDRREAERLTREARGEAGQITVEEAVERALAADVATVLEVLEETARHADDAGDAEVTTGDVAQRAGFVTDAIRARVGATRATLELVDEAERRARRALERGVQDGVIVRRDTAELWRAATDDELERAVERNLDGAEDDAR